MRLINSLLALPMGFQMVFLSKEIRKLCLRPWAIGFLAYIFCLILAFILYDNISVLVFNQLAISKISSKWLSEIYTILISWIASIISFLLFGLMSLLISILIVIISSSILQANLVKSAIKYLGLDSQFKIQSDKSSISNISKLLLGEVLRILIIFILILLSFSLSLIPILFPISLLLSSWLLGVEFIDIVLQQLEFKPLKRIKFVLEYKLSVTLFGFTILILWAIPFLGFLLPPVVIIGATWLICQTPFYLLSKDYNLT